MRGVTEPREPSIYAPGPYDRPPTRPIPLPDPPQPRGSVNWVVVIPAMAAAVLVLMAAAGGAVWFLLRPPGVATVPPPTRGTLQVQGAMNLSQGQFIWNGGADTTCTGWKGFDDIRGGTEIVVSDASGKTLVVGELATGHATGITNDTATGCRLGFSITGVPAGVGPYGVEIGHRGVTHYSQGSLTGLELGFD